MNNDYDEIQLIISTEDQSQIYNPETMMETAVRIFEEETKLSASPDEVGECLYSDENTMTRAEGYLVDEHSRLWSFCADGDTLNYSPED